MMHQYYKEGRTVPLTLTSAFVVVAIPLFGIVIGVSDNFLLNPLFWIMTIGSLCIFFGQNKLHLNFIDQEFRKVFSIFGLNFGKYESIESYDCMVMAYASFEYSDTTLQGSYVPGGGLFRSRGSVRNKTYQVALVDSSTKSSYLIYNGSKNMATQIAIAISKHCPDLITY